MANAEGLNRERPHFETAARVERSQRVRRDLELLQLIGEEPAGKGAGVDRHTGKLRKDVRQSADVVFVSVGDEDRLYGTSACPQVTDVGNDDVDTQGGLVREGEAAVNEDDRVLILVEVEVLPDLPHAAEGDEAQRGSARRRLMGSAGLLGVPGFSWSACRLWASRHSASPVVLERGRVGTESTSRRVASPAPSRASALRYARKAAMSRSNVGRKLPLCSAAAGW